MINTIIYSKDRASQLHLLLQSLKLNAPGVFNINILYKASTDEFMKGYQKLIDENLIPGINWVKEQDFKKQNLELLESECEYFCFMTDDDIIYKPVSESIITNTLEQDEDIFCFSLRLGKNITKCYTQNTSNVLIPLEESDNIIKWDWTKHFFDFGYPLSVDGHIFRTDDIKTLSNKIPYTNPNTFEAGLQIFDYFPREKMAAFHHSCLVNSPSNIVQTVFENRKGESFGISAEELNKKFLDNQIIDYHKLNFDQIVGCHQEIEYKFSHLVADLKTNE